MAAQPNLKNCNFPNDWNDDIRMNFLFSPFREKAANPEGWDAKMHFWTSLVEDVCLQTSTCVITPSTLCSALERKGRLPQCLEVVLESMQRQGLLVDVDEFSKITQQKGWIGWGFDLLVQKPISWGFSSVQSLLKPSKKDDDRLIVLLVVKDLSTKILNCHAAVATSEMPGHIILLESLEEHCKDICCGMNFELAIIQLQKDGHASVFEESGKKIIKFRRHGEKNVPSLTELDKGILCLQKAKDLIFMDICRLEANISRCNEEAKELVRSDCKSKAMFTLKRRKRLEIVLGKKSKELDNVENLLCQLLNSGSESMILEAYQAGTLAIKSSLKEDLNLDKIDNVMADVEEMLDNYAEVQKTIAKPVSPASENLDEFEDELNEILAAEKESKRSEMKRPSPSRVTDDDLVRRLAALRNLPEGVPPVKKPAVVRPPVKKPAVVKPPVKKHAVVKPLLS